MHALLRHPQLQNVLHQITVVAAEQYRAVSQHLADLLHQAVLGAPLQHGTLHPSGHAQLGGAVLQGLKALDVADAHDIQGIQEQQLVHTEHSAPSHFNVALRAHKAQHELEGVEVLDGLFRRGIHNDALQNPKHVLEKRLAGWRLIV